MLPFLGLLQFLFQFSLCKIAGKRQAHTRLHQTEGGNDLTNPANRRYAANIANLILFFSKENDIYTTLFIIQLCFYLMALAGSFSNFKSGQLKPFKLAYYFVFMNTSVFLGFLRFIRGKQPATWEKARRIQG